MKKSLLLFASILSLSFFVPLGAYASTSISSLSDADHGKTVEVSGYLVDVLVRSDGCGYGVGVGNNRAWREQAQYSEYDDLILEYGCNRWPVAILSSDASLLWKSTDSPAQQWDHHVAYIQKNGYDDGGNNGYGNGNGIVKTSSGDLLVYIGKALKENPDYQKWQSEHEWQNIYQYFDSNALDLHFVKLRGTYLHIKGAFPYENDIVNNNGNSVDTDLQILILDSFEVVDQKESVQERIPFKDGDTTAYIRSITKNPDTLAEYDMIDRRLAKLEQAKSSTLPNLLGWIDTLEQAKKVCTDYVEKHKDTYPNWIPYVVAKTHELTKNADSTIDAKFLRLAGPNATALAKESDPSSILSGLSSSAIRQAYPDLAAVFDRSDKKIMREVAGGMDKAMYDKYVEDASNAALNALFIDSKWKTVQSMYEAALKTEAAEGYRSGR